MRSSNLSFAQAIGIGITMRMTIMTTAVTLLACSPPPLTTDDLYGSAANTAPDAAVVPDAKPVPDTAIAAATPDASTPDTHPAPLLGVLSGRVSDRCSNISVLVGIGGKHTCSFPGKGGYFFSGLPTNVRMTLATAELPGYVPFQKVITVEAGGTTLDIKLERIDEASNSGCDAPRPPVPACVCDGPTCVH